MPISLFSDLLSLLTVHIYCFYTASARIFHWQLKIIVSLFHLFRGKKHNVLRDRIDSCDYDLDQLLLGTILFTLLFFLLPTVLVFYLTFTSARMAIISLKAALDTLLACLNHFPLFALMLRVKDSRRLPGRLPPLLGVSIALTMARWHIFQASTGSHEQDAFCCLYHTPNIVHRAPGKPCRSFPFRAAIYYMLLTHEKTDHWIQSVPLSLRAMFDQYFQLGYRIRKHYLSPSVLLCLATGQFLPPIHRKSLYSLQYSMLPARRASVLEVWTRLTESSPFTSSTSTMRNGKTKHPFRIPNGHGR